MVVECRADGIICGEDGDIEQALSLIGGSFETHKNGQKPNCTAKFSGASGQVFPASYIYGSITMNRPLRHCKSKVQAIRKSDLQYQTMPIDFAITQSL
jgi:hypothetical protein